MPLRYILPAEELLPKESMRSFQLDEQWIANLLLGALGVGGAWRLTDEAKAALPDFEAAFDVSAGAVGAGKRPFGALPTLTGVVMRSQVVSGWPAMNTYADGTRHPLVCRRLSKSMLLVLFKGTVNRDLTFRLPQESLHYESAKKLQPIPKGWLTEATTSVQLGQRVTLARQEEFEWPLGTQGI